MPRSSIAAATGPPCVGRVVDQDADRLRAGVPPREQVLDLAGDGLGLGALVGAAPEAELGLAEPVLELRSRRRRGGASRNQPPSSALGRLERVDVVRVVARRARRAAPAGRGSCPRARRPSGARSARRSASRTSARSSSRQFEGEEDVAAVEAAGRGEDAVVGVQTRRTRARADASGGSCGRSRAARFERSVRSVAPGQQRGPAGRPGCRGSRGGAAAARRGGRAASPAARPGRARRRRGRGRRRRSARAGAARRSSPRCRSRAPRRDRRAAPRRGRAAARAVGAGRGDHQHPLGAAPVGGERASRRASTSVLPVPALAEHQQRPLAVARSRARAPRRGGRASSASPNASAP